MLLLPVTPQLARNFMSLIKGKSFMNDSSEILQPIDAAGKSPNLLNSPKRELPSLLKDADNKYLSLYE